MTLALVGATVAVLVVAPAAATPPASAWGEPLPYAQAGLDERQAAAHLLNRLAYGPRPGEIERVVELGLRPWIEWQLAGEDAGPALAARLARLPASTLAREELLRRYPHPAWLLAEAVERGVVSAADVAGDHGEARRRQALADLGRYARGRGYRTLDDAIAEIRAEKLYRAVLSESQLVEVLTDFWSNHFNVAAACLECRAHLLPYERDAVRPRVLGTFRELLGAVARHPAMLLYLGNAHSVAERRTRTTLDVVMADLGGFSPVANASRRQRLAMGFGWRPKGTPRPKRQRGRGLNENYARELLELHTLGVDGGYDEDDVYAVARALSGWTVLPWRTPSERKLAYRLRQAAEEAELGFVVENGFVFRADQHDAGKKTVLGVPLPAGRGIEDGEEVLDLVAAHPATARHLARKLAVRFVSDRPPAALVERLAHAFELSGGDLRQVMRSLIAAPEFWQAGREPDKLKSPFELVVSALRAVDAEIHDPTAAVDWIARGGQPLYGYAAPTGFADREEAWTSVGSLLGRLSFALELAAGKVPGVEVDLHGLVGERPFAAREEAVRAYLPLLLPERRIGPVLARLAGLDREPEAPSAAPAAGADADAERRRSLERARAAMATLLASPDFQRR